MSQAVAMNQPREDLDPGRDEMLALKAGDPAAFESILRLHGPKVIAFFERFGADPATAEDLAQETFLRVYRARDRYEPTARFATWLHRIAQRIAINEATRNRWRRAVGFAGEDEDDEGGIAAPPDQNALVPHRQLSIKELQAQVEQAIGRLPGRQRFALLLNRFEGLSYEQIGEVLGLKIPAVKSLLFRARENLKNALLPYLDQDLLGEVDDVERE